MVAVRNCCYVAVCSATRGTSAPTGEERGGGISWRPPAYSVLYMRTVLTTVGFVSFDVDSRASVGHLATESVDAHAPRLARRALQRAERSVRFARHRTGAEYQLPLTLHLTQRLHCQHVQNTHTCCTGETDKGPRIPPATGIRVVNDTFQKYRRYSISIPVLKVSSIPISILFRKSIDIDTSISILS